MQGTISFSLLLFAINKAYSINPRNIIMIFNINSTRGQTRFLTGNLLVVIMYTGP